jgi:hypothetical protein
MQRFPKIEGKPYSHEVTSHSETGHPTQLGIQAHDHVQYNTFTQI